MKAVAQPELIVLNQWEYFLIRDGIQIADNHKLLTSLNNPGQKLTKKRERGIG